MFRSPHARLVIRRCLVVCAVLALPAGAAARGTVDPQAEAVLTKLSRCWGEVQRVQVDITTTVAHGPADQRFRIEIVGEALYEPDKRLHLLPSSSKPFMNGRPMPVLHYSLVSGGVVADGFQLHVFAPHLRRLVTRPLTGALDGATSIPELTQSHFVGGLLMQVLVRPDPVAWLTQVAEDIRHAGTEPVAGQSCHKLVATLAGRKVTLWVPVVGPPLLRQLMVRSADPQQQGPRITERYTNWRVNEPRPENAFNVKRLDKLAHDALLAIRNGKQNPGAVLIGQPAPQQELPLLGGGKFDLARHQGEDVVILDFWATWCLPCRKSMPALVELAREYEDRNVVLYAVNSGEKAEKIRQFLKDQQWELAVPLDVDQKLGRAYYVSGIPHLVVVDQQGVVRHAQSGFSPRLKDQLRDLLDSLLPDESAG